jgi:hypothetical protein
MLKAGRTIIETDIFMPRFSDSAPGEKPLLLRSCKFEALALQIVLGGDKFRAEHAKIVRGLFIIKIDNHWHFHWRAHFR